MSLGLEKCNYISSVKIMARLSALYASSTISYLCLTPMTAKHPSESTRFSGGYSPSGYLAQPYESKLDRVQILSSIGICHPVHAALHIPATDFHFKARPDQRDPRCQRPQLSIRKAVITQFDKIAKSENGA